MTSDLRKMPELVVLFQDHKDEIVTAWAKKVHSIPTSHYQQYSLEEITEWTAQGFGNYRIVSFRIHPSS